MNTFQTKLVALWLTVADVLSGGRSTLRVRTAASRGAGFFEYMLLGGLAVAVAYVLHRTFPGMFEGMMEKIRDAGDGNFD